MAKNLPQVISQKFNTAEVDLLRSTYAKGLDDTQLKVFIKMAEAMDLNPFTKEIYANVINGRLVLMTSIGGLRKIAHKTGDYLGCSTQFIMKEDVLYSAKTIVKKLVKGHVAEFEAEAFFDEYNTGRDMWKKMPRGQLSKCSEALALRKAFSQIEGFYEESERGAVEAIQADVHADVVPDYENESQSFPPENQSNPDPGEFLVAIGSRKDNPMKLKDVPREELMEYVKWCYTQKRLAGPLQEYLAAAESYLEVNQN